MLISSRLPTSRSISESADTLSQKHTIIKVGKDPSGPTVKLALPGPPPLTLPLCLSPYSRALREPHLPLRGEPHQALQPRMQTCRPEKRGALQRGKHKPTASVAGLPTTQASRARNQGCRQNVLLSQAGLLCLLALAPTGTAPRGTKTNRRPPFYQPQPYKKDGHQDTQAAQPTGKLRPKHRLSHVAARRARPKSNGRGSTSHCHTSKAHTGHPGLQANADPASQRNRSCKPHHTTAMR